MADLPQSIRDMAIFPPVEDLVLPIMRQLIPDVPIYSLIPEGANDFPFLLVRRHFSGQYWRGDPRGFVNGFFLRVDAFASDPDGDEKAAVLAEAARVALYKAVREGVTIPGVGRLSHVRTLNDPRRAPDWATATGPVQYADLPTGTWRYEAIYRCQSRHDL